MACFQSFSLHFVSSVSDPSAVCAIGVFDGGTTTHSPFALTDKTRADVKTILTQADFSGKTDALICPWVSTDKGFQSLVALGLGKPEDCDLYWTKRGAALWTTIRTKGPTVVLDFSDDCISPRAVAHMVAGLKMRAWEFDCYKTKKDTDAPKRLKDVHVIHKDIKAVQDVFDDLDSVIKGNILTRRVVSEPPNVLYPEAMSEKARKLASLGVEVEVLGEAEMRTLGMNALLGVGQGSAKESQLIVLKWNGGTPGKAPVAFVGKGVTFDTGGISIKPSLNMDDMKNDMAGSGVVLGLFKTLALRKAKVNAVGILGMVENMPSGTAQRPADIVTSLSGQTIEVLNTDAEGRLVLADALWYAQDRFKPKFMIDLATLTGAIVVALGHEYAGLFSNNDTLATELESMGRQVGEHLWRLPMCDSFDKDIDSDAADVQNISSGRGAGSATAAHFLKRFVNNVPWAHLDIAGVAWDKKARPLTGKGATGFGVRLLDQWIRHYHEV